jgi:hypothetical protein
MDRGRLQPGNAVCGMSSIVPVAQLPYPFLNHTRPLTQNDADELMLDLSKIKGPEGFGTVCVVVNDSGEPSVLFERR